MKVNLKIIIKAAWPITAILLVISLSGLYDFLLFHVIAEFMSIIIAVLVFVLAANSRRQLDNGFLLFLGVAYFYIAIIDLIHTLTYSGMNLIIGYDSNLPTQLWLAERFLGAVSLFIALTFYHRRFNYRHLHLIYALITFLILADLFFFKLLPAAYTEDHGLTNFKIYSEYIISAILFGALITLFYKRHQIDRRIFFYLQYSIVSSILSELILTLYFNVYGVLNLTGHLFKILSFYFIYLAVVKTGLADPQRLIFKKLADSEARLKESEERYRSLVELSPDAIIVHGDGVIKFVNLAATKLLAEGKEKLIGRRIIDLVHPDFKNIELQRLSRLYDKSIKTPRTILRIVNFYDRDIDVEVESAPISIGDKIMAQSILRDITQRVETENNLKNYTKQLEELTNEIFKFQLAVEDASDMITITDTRGVIIYANKATELKTGYSNQEIIGHTSRLWGNNLLTDKIERQKEGKQPEDLTPVPIKSFYGEATIRTKSGKEFISEARISPVYNAKKEILFYVCIENDITGQKEIEKIKSEFVYFVSHQLKNPLTSILLAVEMIFREAAGIITDRQKGYINDIKDSAKKMTKLITALLNLSKLELGIFTINPEPMDLTIQFNELIYGLNSQIENKGLILNKIFPPRQPIIVMDTNVFNLIFENLLANAIQYTDNNGTITIELKNQDNEIIIRISDTGCGIPEYAKAKIFSKLYRAENAKRMVANGTGLGLYIVKTVADKIGARVWFESKENTGTTFFVALPLDKFRAE